MNMIKLLSAYRRNEDGVTLVEYGIGITLALVLGTAALSGLAEDIGGAMGVAGAQMCDAAPAAGTYTC